MADIKLSLEKREVAGKKLAALRDAGKVPAVVYGGESEPVMVQGEYNEIKKALSLAGYHSTLDLDIAGKKQLAIVKNVDINPVSRKLMNVEFQAVSADKAIEATTPIVLEGFETSEANKLHYVVLQVMEEIEVKAKPADLPEKIVADASKFATLDDKLTVADLVLPKGVELADKELSSDQVVASIYDPAAEAAAREAEEAAAAAAAAAGETTEAADVPSDNGSKPEEESAEENKE
ncbi:MAG: 50S ribosomal protein L25 [Candidatus Saccharibacteria bacterium]|nr:50S ribosomal protein L25 [Candidatus Saccharibacteria bacterium]